MNLETNEDKKLAFKLLREMWIAVANESATLEPEELARQIASVEKIQARLVS